jgi:TIR domain
MKKVFISYSSADRLKAFELFQLLEQEKYDAWLDYFDIMPSEKLDAELHKNISGADVVCIILSPNSMSSKWVEYEIKAATSIKTGKPRIVGVITHSCNIPEFISDIIHIDARVGFATPTFFSKLKRAIDQKEIEQQDLLLDSARKEELAKQSIIEKAEKDLPLYAEELKPYLDKAIESISININPIAFEGEQKVIYELILTYDTLFDEPLHFYFTSYNEGKTWPDEFGFSEPPFSDFYKAAKPKIDGKFCWRGQKYDFANTMDGTDFKDMDASFSFTFRDQKYVRQPLSTKEKFAFPTLKELFINDSFFELIAHFPETKTAKRLNVFNSEIDLRFSVSIENEKKWLNIFKTRHNYEEELAHLCGFMKSQSNMIFKEAVMNDFVHSKPALNANERKQRIATILHENGEVAQEDYTLAGFYCYSSGAVPFLRKNFYEASQWYYKATQFLQAAVFEKFPTYKEAMLLFESWNRLAACVDINRNAELKSNYIHNLGIISDHLIDVFPQENDYKRLMVEALFKNAEMSNYDGKPEHAAECVIEAIAILLELYEEISNKTNYDELVKYKVTALQLFESTATAQYLPVNEWKSELDKLNPNARKILKEDQQKKKEGPVWLIKTVLEKWPVEVFNSSLLRYSIAIPKRWDKTPVLSTTQYEVNQLFRGPWPSEFLSVSFMEKATAGGNMANWVDLIGSVTGVPVLEFNKEPNVAVSEWIHEGSLESVAKKYKADEAHCYNGIIELNDANRHRARIYILLLRKGEFAWKFILSFETAMITGMPPDTIYKQDHVRAGATFGELII